ncbi:hypothetical protein PVE_R2G0395 [Pseudomonas veronii 1YdBTEX2]|uniref:Uncharacterized protein n=1 Tax=Pseudomonas veronii 1YdBTEX2 TaxID=1295141 RepID=A0A1D3K834_PSEVE|nr:hypothetical protein PVE_R2G0395 [Pseudomonas veronii 1YdBTEX2]
MKSAAQQAPLFSSLFASAGITDLSKIVSLSFDLQPQINKRSITYREQTTVYVDDLESQVRLVVRLKVESKKRGAKRVVLPDSYPDVQVARLEGYDPVKHVWGTVSHTTNTLPEPELAEAWQAHQELEAIRANMKQSDRYTWYPITK